MLYEGPISLGTDDNNVYEYSVELDSYKERWVINNGYSYCRTICC
jgi:hypothetical protein